MANARTLLASIGRRMEMLAQGHEKRLDWLEAHPVGVHLESLLAIRTEDWAGLAALAAGWRSEAEADLAGITAQRSAVLGLFDEIEQLKLLGVERWRVPGRRPDWPEIRGHMQAEGERQGLPAEQVLRAIETFKTQTWSKISGAMMTGVGYWSSQLDQAALSRFRALAAADLADVVALASSSPLGRAQVSLAQAQGAMQGLLDHAERLRLAFRDGEVQSVLRSARALSRGAQAILPRLARTAARLARSEDRDHAIAVGSALRLSLTSLSVARLAAWRGGWVPSPLASAWRTAARKLRSDRGRAPTRTDIRTVLDAPGRFDGRRVRFEGRVVNVTTTHRRGKAYSTATIRDENGAEAQLGIAHIKMDSGGMVPGAHAAVSGTFHRRHKDFTGSVVVLAQRNKAKEGRTQWGAWLQSEVASLIAPIPHGLDVETSWVPGRNGAANLLRYGVWSSISSGSVL